MSLPVERTIDANSRCEPVTLSDLTLAQEHEAVDDRDVLDVKRRRLQIAD